MSDQRLEVAWRKRCPICAERLLNSLTTLVSPRCKVCKGRFRVRLPLGLGFSGHYVSRLVLLASVVAALALGGSAAFSLGLYSFVALEVAVFLVGRLEPDRRDPITVMQLRRYGRRPEKEG